MTTNTVAARLSTKTGPALVMAAIAKLILVDGRETVPRKELLTEMQSATSYYKSTFGGGNLTKSLTKLVKDGKLNEPAKDVYALAASTRQALENQLAQQ